MQTVYFHWNKRKTSQYIRTTKTSLSHTFISFSYIYIYTHRTFGCSLFWLNLALCICLSIVSVALIEHRIVAVSVMSVYASVYMLVAEYNFDKTQFNVVIHSFDYIGWFVFSFLLLFTVSRSVLSLNRLLLSPSLTAMCMFLSVCVCVLHSALWKIVTATTTTMVYALRCSLCDNFFLVRCSIFRRLFKWISVKRALCRCWLKSNSWMKM